MYARFTKAWIRVFVNLASCLLLLIVPSSCLPRPHQITCTHKNKKRTFLKRSWLVYLFICDEVINKPIMMLLTNMTWMNTQQRKKQNKITWTWHTDSIVIAFYYQLRWKSGIENYTNINTNNKIIRSPL